MEFVTIVAFGKRTPEQQLLKLYKTITSMIKKKMTCINWNTIVSGWQAYYGQLV